MNKHHAINYYDPLRYYPRYMLPYFIRVLVLTRTRNRNNISGIENLNIQTFPGVYLQGHHWS